MPGANPAYNPAIGDLLSFNGRSWTVLAASGRQMTLKDSSGVVTTGYFNPLTGIDVSATGAALFTAAAAGGNTGSGAIAASSIFQGGAFSLARGPYTITFSNAADAFNEQWLTWAVTDTNGQPVPSYDPNLATIIFPGNTPVALALASAPQPQSSSGLLAAAFSGSSGLYCITGWGTPVTESGGQAGFAAAGDTFRPGSCVFANLVNGQAQFQLTSPAGGPTAALAQWPGWPNPMPLSLEACLAVVYGPQFVTPQVIQFMGIAITISGTPNAGDSFVITPWASF